MAAVSRVLVTGKSGFVGSFLNHSSNSYIALDDDHRRVDVRDIDAVRMAIANMEFDAVIHMAAQSSVAGSLVDPRTTLDVNTGGTVNLLTALEEKRFCGRFLYVSSSEVYGDSPTGEAIRERVCPRPKNPYGVSKLSAELLCRAWGQRTGASVVIARPFNHIGPGQSSRFVISSFAKQLVEVKKGSREARIVTGNRKVVRDFCDVRDVVNAYALLLNRGQRDHVYNVCSGVGVEIGEILGLMSTIMGVSVSIETDRALLRNNEAVSVVGSYSKIHDELGWRPTVELPETLEEMIRYWEKSIG